MPSAPTPTTTSTGCGLWGSRSSERISTLPEIETERLLLRHWTNEDIEPYARICADPEVMRYIGDGSVLSREQSREQVSRFVRHWEDRGFGLWAVEHREYGALIGFIGLEYQDDWPVGEHKTEVGWRLDRRFWGNGFATEGATASLRFSFETLGLERIISIADPRNAASRRVMEKAGLTFRGEARWRGYDDVWYAADRSDWSG